MFVTNCQNKELQKNTKQAIIFKRIIEKTLFEKTLFAAKNLTTDMTITLPTIATSEVFIYIEYTSFVIRQKIF